MRAKVTAGLVFSVLALGCGNQAPGSSTRAQVVREPLIGAPARPTRTVAAMMFDLGSGPPDRAQAEDVFVGAEGSMRGIYVEASFGMQDISVDMLGPYTLPVANRCLTLACCGPSSDRTGNGDEVQRLIDALPMEYDHYFWVYGAQTDPGCGTWGDAGEAMDPAVYSSFEFVSLTAAAQEIGHNFGMEHEHTLNCGGETLPDDPSSCSNNEYGSRLSFMGMGRGHPSAYHKANQGWISGCNIIKAGGAGTFNLFPLEAPCNATQLIQIQAPKARGVPIGNDVAHYYAELRVPVGYDERVVESPQVMLYIGGELTPGNRYAGHTFLLDLTPDTSALSDAGLASVGQSFQDPAGGLTITLDAISESGAVITVAGNGTGAHTCDDDTAFTAPGPTSCGDGAGGVVGTGGTGGGSGSGGSSAGGAGGGSGGVISGGASGSAGGGSGGVTTAGTAGVVTNAGSGGAVNAAGTGANAVTAGAGPAPDPALDGGCGCRTSAASPRGALLTSLILLGLFGRRRARLFGARS